MDTPSTDRARGDRNYRLNSTPHGGTRGESAINRYRVRFKKGETINPILATLAVLVRGDLVYLVEQKKGGIGGNLKYAPLRWSPEGVEGSKACGQTGRRTKDNVLKGVARPRISEKKKVAWGRG